MSGLSLSWGYTAVMLKKKSFLEYSIQLFFLFVCFFLVVVVVVVRGDYVAMST